MNIVVPVTPNKAIDTLFQDVFRRDLTTARRASLLDILWQERYLTRSNLITRVEGLLGVNCFGAAAWEDTFYRDMRGVKAALKNAGYELVYSRGKSRPGYYIRGEARIHANLAAILDGSVDEVDMGQIEINQGLSPAQRFQKGCSICDLAREVISYRIEQRQKQCGLGSTKGSK